MRFNIVKNTVLLFVLGMISCGNFSKKNTDNLMQIKDDEILKTEDSNQQPNNSNQQLILGANQTDAYLAFLKGKRVGIVANQTSVIFVTNPQQPKYTHLVDSLVALNIDLKAVFAPEHGFRGTADAGEHIKDGVDTKTGVPIISLYGDNKKPKPEQLKNIDIMIFDIQDVGARFYTYISSLHYVMEACAEARIPVLILDRPNPNGYYMDGPVLEMQHKSFVGMHPIPVVHGMTIAEYAKMINGEKWLKNGIQCEINIIPLKNYTHQIAYSLPIKPSPNLPNDISVNLYASLCFFEGTNVSVGRGTNKQFQVFGSPDLNKTTFNYSFTPKSSDGAKSPMHQDKICYGLDLTETKSLDGLNLGWLISAYENTKNKTTFFNAFFTKLAGTKKLQQQIEAGLGEVEIKASWQKGLETFKTNRAKYLIYK